MSEFASSSSKASIDVPSSSSSLDIETLKKEANELFLAGRYEEAERLYTSCLSKSVDGEVKVILLSNRAAARLGLKKFDEALEDANEALSISPSALKAYYRKASALEGLQKQREAYETWLSAEGYCESTPALTKQLILATEKWKKVFRSPQHPIDNIEDLVRRYQLLTDKRERLSTLAHFWNDSTQIERFNYFLLLIRLIGGEGVLSEANRDFITSDVMVPMPMHNYIDLPRERLQSWFDFFQVLPSDEKTSIYERIWNNLSSEEKNDIIVDLKLFLSPPGEPDSATEEN